jgi:hypothetical protein
MATQPLLDVELTTSLLMAQLELDDIEELRMLAADEATLEEEGLTNEEFALRIQARYIQNMYQIMEDRMFALTFDQGLEADYPAFRNINPASPAPPAPRTNPPSPQLIVQHPDDDDDDGDDDELEYVLNLAAFPSPYVSSLSTGSLVDNILSDSIRQLFPGPDQY